MPNRLNKNFIQFKGDVRSLNYTFTELEDLDTDTNAIEWYCRNEGGTTVITKTVANGGITKHNVDVIVGESTVSKKILAKVVLDPANTATLDAGKYYYQLMVKDTADRYVTCAVGEMDLREAFRS